jgi:hypothetical protein
LTFEKSRAGQLDRYVELFAKGVPSLDAARTVFGNLGQLNGELKTYMNRSRMTYLQLKGDALRPGPIDIKPMSEGASKVILLRATLKNGVTAATAEPLAAQIRTVEASFPGDELVEASLAEAELEADPNNTEPLVLKGRAIMARAEKAPFEQSHSLFEQARAAFIRANKIDSEDPEPLLDYYRTYPMEGVRPNENAIAALHYASDLAPQDIGLRMNSAIQYLIEGKLAEARTALIPIAYDPHGEEIAQVARQVLARVEAGDTKGALAATRGKPAGEASAH